MVVVLGGSEIQDEVFMKKFKIVCVIGTRSEALKMIPVIKALQKIELFDVHIIITGRHRELLNTLL